MQSATFRQVNELIVVSEVPAQVSILSRNAFKAIVYMDKYCGLCFPATQVTQLDSLLAGGSRHCHLWR